MAHSVSSSSSSSPGSASCRSASSKSNARLGVLAVPRLGLRPDGGAVRQLYLTGEPVLHPGSKPLERSSALGFRCYPEGDRESYR